MTTEANYQQKIKGYNWKKLLFLWEEIKARHTPDWESGKAMEYLILRAFELEGAEVVWPYTVQVEDEEVEQIDGVVYSNGLACLLECKDTDKRVNIEPIAKLRNQLLRRPLTAMAIIFSRSGFTESSFTLAKFITTQTIILWSGDEIEYALHKRYFCQGLVKKYRYCIEQGMSYYNLENEDDLL